jgi:hypothetical protein
MEIHHNLMEYEKELVERETEERQPRSRITESFKNEFINASAKKSSKKEPQSEKKPDENFKPEIYECKSETALDKKTIDKKTVTSGKLLLPPLQPINSFNTVKYGIRPSPPKLDSQSFSEMFAINQKVYYKQKLITRRPEDPLTQIFRYRKQEFNKKKNFLKLIQKYRLSDGRDFKTTRHAGSKKVDISVWQKYCTYNKKYRQDIVFDEDNKPLISQFDLDKGLLNLIYKGLVPKDADLSPAFNRETHPLQVNVNDIKEIYKSGIMKKELEISNLLKNIDFHTQDSSTSLFITGDNNSKSVGRCSDKRGSLNVKDQELQFPGGNKSNRSKKESNKNRGIVITLFNYQFVHDKQYYNFKKKFNTKWKELSYILEKIAEIFKKLAIANAEFDSNKIEKLSDRDPKHINNKDLLNCLTETDLKRHGFQDPLSMYESIQSAFAKKIQSWTRVYLAKKKVNNERHFINSILKIQNTYRYYITNSQIKKMIEEENSKKAEIWGNTMQAFKANWRNIKNSSRIEIHVNSLSCSCDRNCTIEKFKERENNQLARLINLADPNVEIIYISSYQLTTEVLSYYFSILQTLGIDDAKNRFYLIVPDINQTLPINYSISQLLYLSHKSLNLIKSQIIGKNAYIVPGCANKYDISIAMDLNCPIMASDYNLTGVMFSKSGCKRLLEIGEINSTVSAWDIYDEDEFYNQLTSLIISYPKYNTWIFKINNEFNGRGIAYFDLDKSKNIVDLKDNINALEGQTLNSQLNYLLRKVILFYI